MTKKIAVLAIVTAMLSTPTLAALGFLTGERVDGMNKICFYDVLGSTYTLNIDSYEICPVSYNF